MYFLNQQPKLQGSTTFPATRTISTEGNVFGVCNTPQVFNENR